jgi:hypothetical protein
MWRNKLPDRKPTNNRPPGVNEWGTINRGGRPQNGDKPLPVRTSGTQVRPSPQTQQTKQPEPKPVQKPVQQHQPNQQTPFVWARLAHDTELATTLPVFNNGLKCIYTEVQYDSSNENWFIMSHPKIHSTDSSGRTFVWMKAHFCLEESGDVYERYVKVHDLEQNIHLFDSFGFYRPTPVQEQLEEDAALDEFRQ